MFTQHIFLLKKTSSDQFGTIPFAKMFLYFDSLTWTPALNLESFSLLSCQNLCARLYIDRLHFDCTMIGIVGFINYIR